MSWPAGEKDEIFPAAQLQSTLAYAYQWFLMSGKPIPAHEHGLSGLSSVYYESSASAAVNLSALIESARNSIDAQSYRSYSERS